MPYLRVLLSARKAQKSQKKLCFCSCWSENVSNEQNSKSTSMGFIELCTDLPSICNENILHFSPVSHGAGGSVVVLTTLVLFVLIRIKSNSISSENRQFNIEERSMIKALSVFGILIGIAILTNIRLAFHPKFIIDLVATYVTMIMFYVLMPLQAIMKHPTMRKKLLQRSQESIYDVII